MKLLLLPLLLSVTSPLCAQDSVRFTPGEETGIRVSLGADLVNQYIWRGQDLGNVSLQPTVGVEWKGLSLSAWGSEGLSNWQDTKELDLTLGYSAGGFCVGVTDYWFSDGSYFQYGAHRTTHVWEANVGYDFEVVSVKWFTNVAGDDGANHDGKRAYSSYCELTAPFRLGGLDWAAAVGVVPYETTFYDADGFCVTLVSLRVTRDIAIKEKFHLPVFAGLTANPRSEKLYLLAGVSFSL